MFDYELLGVIGALHEMVSAGLTLKPEALSKLCLHRLRAPDGKTIFYLGDASNVPTAEEQAAIFAQAPEGGTFTIDPDAPDGERVARADVEVSGTALGAMSDAKRAKVEALLREILGDEADSAPSWGGPTDLDTMARDAMKARLAPVVGDIAAEKLVNVVGNLKLGVTSNMAKLAPNSGVPGAEIMSGAPLPTDKAAALSAMMLLGLAEVVVMRTVAIILGEPENVLSAYRARVKTGLSALGGPLTAAFAIGRTAAVEWVESRESAKKRGYGMYH